MSALDIGKLCSWKKEETVLKYNTKYNGFSLSSDSRHP